ncbi:MAG: hypothetical protein LBS70_05440 [Candidatus Accumulibacter sp.]|jgi:hypothetical protein|nr:hypothetical protein [Accumulibacter sp.]
MKNELPLKRFPAGTFIELANPADGETILARVCESGTEFIATAGETPLPIFQTLNPVEIGDFRTLKHEALENRPAEYAQFSDFVSRLFDALPDFDDLFFMRAVKWGFDTRDYKTAGDVGRALARARQLEERAKSCHARFAASEPPKRKEA